MGWRSILTFQRTSCRRITAAEPRIHGGEQDKSTVEKQTEQVVCAVKHLCANDKRIGATIRGWVHLLQKDGC